MSAPSSVSRMSYQVPDLEELALHLLLDSSWALLSFLLWLPLIVGLVSKGSLLPDEDDGVHVVSIVEQLVVVRQLIPFEEEPLQVLGQIKPRVEIQFLERSQNDGA